jgi:hypothetical protein
MTTDTSEMTAPTERQLRVLELVRERLSKRWPVSQLNDGTKYDHWEDESLGIPPRWRYAWFEAEAAPLTLTISTPSPSDSLPPESVIVKFHTYSVGEPGPAWAILEDAKTRRALAAAGFASHSRSWTLGASDDESVANAIFEAIGRLAAVEWRVLRDKDIPATVRRPWKHLVDVLAADRVVSIEEIANGKRRITSEIEGDRKLTQVDAGDMDLLSWWWNNAAVTKAELP